MHATGLALKQLTDNEGRPYHANIRHNKRREKGKWLAETVKETMTSISMNEDLYDSDDEMLPPSALRKRNRQSAVGFKTLTCNCPSQFDQQQVIRLPIWRHRLELQSRRGCTAVPLKTRLMVP